MPGEISAEKLARFKTAERNKRRVENLGYCFAGDPFDSDHEEWIDDQRKRGPSVDKGKGVSQVSIQEINKTRSFSDSTTSSTSDKRPIIWKDEPLAENEWPILLQFGNGKFEGKVLLDSACPHNWISDRVVRQYKMPWDDDPNGGKVYQDFSNNGVSSKGISRVNWIHKHKTIEVDFKIAQDPPFEVLFGAIFLIRNSLIKFFKDTPAAPLVMDKRKPSASDKKEMEQAKKQVQEKATNIKMLMDWRKGMENDGWSWSKPHNNYYKTNEQGERIWNEVGFLVDRWVDDPLQAKR